VVWLWVRVWKPGLLKAWTSVDFLKNAWLDIRPCGAPGSTLIRLSVL
jgi:hypothetical protein